MAYASRAGRARTRASAPQAHAICDRCGFRYNHVDLKFQFDWAGDQLQNFRILVCDRCLDTPQDQNRAIVVPADPVPILNPRPLPSSSRGPALGMESGPDILSEGGETTLNVEYGPDSSQQDFSVTGYPNEILYLSQLSEIGEPANLPKTLPTDAGAYWNNSGVLSVTPLGDNPLPTSLPNTQGTFWNNNGAVNVTAGGSFPALALQNPAGLTTT